MSIEDDITKGYTAMIEERISWGFEPFILTFMFNQLKGSPQHISCEMKDEVERVYGFILTRTWKEPKRKHIVDMPFWIGSPDWPVYKRDKDHFRDIVLNDGRHIHMLVCQPSESHMKMRLDQLVDDDQRYFSGKDKRLWHLHIEPIVKTPEKATGYVLKSLERKRASIDDLIILPRTHGEMTSMKYREKRAVKLGDSIITPTFEQDRTAAQVQRMRKGGR